MPYRFAFDLGTDSIGWCVLEMTDGGELKTLTDAGVRIFSDGRDPESKKSLNEERRDARGLRRSIWRRRQRRRNLFKILQANGLFPATKEEAQALKIAAASSLSGVPPSDTEKTDAHLPYVLRVRALDEKLSPYELGRALFHLGRRRGFKSNRIAQNEDEAAEPAKATKKKDETDAEQTVQKAGKLSQEQRMTNLAQAIQNENLRTLGEFLLARIKELPNGGTARFKADMAAFYPTRALYEAEFTAIRKKQETFYPNIDWDAMYKAIFYQRELKPQERGKCACLSDKERTFKHMPCVHRYRILQDVYNLKGSYLGKPQELTAAQQDAIIKKLNTQKTLSFDAIRRELKVGWIFNLERSSRGGILKGNETAVSMRKAEYFGSLWDKLSLSKQDDIIELLLTAQQDEEVRPLLDSLERDGLRLTEEQKNAILKYPWKKTGTAAYCRELLEQLVSLMEEKRLPLTEALKTLGYAGANQTVEKREILPYYGEILTGAVMQVHAKTSQGKTDKHAQSDTQDKNPEMRYGKIANPTVHIALNQLRIVVNALIRRYGKPNQIAVELARELKHSIYERRAIEADQAARAHENRIINKNIRDCTDIDFPDRADRQKYRLWEELGAETFSRRCLYCGRPISAAELFTSSIEIEHILPYSRTLLNAESNLTVAHAQCNRFKKERSPYEAFGHNPPGYNWLEILDRVSALKSKPKQLRFSENAMEHFEKDNTFLESQLTDTQYIAKISLQYLRVVCDDVWPVKGQMTSRLRDRWDINGILQKRPSEALTDLQPLPPRPEKQGKSDEAYEKELAAWNDVRQEQAERVGKYLKNRCDHRHHALDAIVIGCCDRSLVKRIADMNRERTTDKQAIPTLPIRREDIIDRLRRIVPSFKPDHGVEGKLSKETLLAKVNTIEKTAISALKEEDVRLIRSAAIREEWEELTAERGNFNKAKKEFEAVHAKEFTELELNRAVYANRKALSSFTKPTDIESIIDRHIKEEMRKFVAEAGEGRKFEELMQEFSQKKGIKRLRCKAAKQTSIHISANPKNPLSSDRYLNPVDYFAVIIWQIPQPKDKPPKYEGQYLRRTEVHADGTPKNDEKPHPAAKKICVLHKQDCIEFNENGVWLQARVAGLKASDNRLDIRPVCATQDVKSWLESIQDSMANKNWAPNPTQNFVAINVLFGKKSARSITVDPIGRIHRKS